MVDELESGLSKGQPDQSADSALQFVNDWSELEAAIQDLDNLDRLDGLTNPAGYSSIEVIQSYVPRLLTQYANLVELSFALTEGWEQYVKVQAPSQLYLPDHR